MTVIVRKESMRVRKLRKGADQRSIIYQIPSIFLRELVERERGFITILILDMALSHLSPVC